MNSVLLLPLMEVLPDPVVAALPKADIHIHQESPPRLDRLLARQIEAEPTRLHAPRYTARDQC